MKKKYYLIFLALILSLVFQNTTQAQSCLVMDYDADGNRISRQLMTNCVEKREIVEEQEIEMNEEVKVYPNPNNGVFKVIMQSYDKQENAYYELYDINGVLVQTNKLYADETEIDVGTAIAGIYLLKIKNCDNVISKIILIQ